VWHVHAVPLRRCYLAVSWLHITLRRQWVSTAGRFAVVRCAWSVIIGSCDIQGEVQWVTLFWSLPAPSSLSSVMLFLRAGAARRLVFTRGVLFTIFMLTALK
jgi:hypothetical protein